MNWDAVAAIAEVIGVVGLIVSIGYLGLQTRQGNRIAEDVAFRGVFSLALEQNRAMIEGDNRDVIIKGLLKYDEMVGSEKITFDNMMLNFVTVIESALLSSDMELLHDDQPEGFGYYIRTRLLPYSGTRSWWSDSKGIFAPNLQNWIAAEISKADMDSDFFGIKDNA